MPHSTKKLGMMFTAAAWILGFLLLALFFSKILDQQSNPNQSISTLQTADFQEVVLIRSRSGHYKFDGEINRHKVTFLVDTGATITAIPGELQQKLGLKAGPATSVSTANGLTTAYLTRLDQLSIGGQHYSRNGCRRNSTRNERFKTLRTGTKRRRTDHSAISIKVPRYR
jgi:aspartyl protease family protein